MKTYSITEIFHTVQGEGAMTGTPAVFVRFTGCNLQCRADDPDSGFDCDAEFASGKRYTLEELAEAIAAAHDVYPAPRWLVLTGGEPSLQIDHDLCDYLHAKGFQLAVETNGTKELPWRKLAADELLSDTALYTPDGSARYLVDWVCVSPKSAEHTLRQLVANEVKYVRNADQALPRPFVRAKHKFLSPAFSTVGVDGVASIDRRAVANCLELVKQNPDWAMTLQTHKWLRVR